MSWRMQRWVHRWRQRGEGYARWRGWGGTYARPYQRCQDHNVALLHQNGTLDVKRKKPMMVFSPPILAPLPIIGGMNWDE